MKEWYSAAEIVGLPDLPSTERRIRERAKRDGWESRARSALGGGREYCLSSLPPAAVAALHMAEAANANALSPSEEASKEAWAHFERLSQKKKDEAARRLRAIRAVEALTAGGMSPGAAVEEIADQAATTPSTVYRWFGMIDGVSSADRLPALASRQGGRTSTADCHPDAWEAFKADYLRPEQPAAAACYHRLKKLAAQHGWSIPACKTLERRLEREIPEPVRILRRKGEEALERLYPAQKRDKSHLAALEAVNADGHTFDVRVKWEDGSEGRPVLVGWQDVRSGKLLSWRIGETECTELVRLAFADMVEKWGVPERAHLDNGRSFASKTMTGGAKTRYRFKIRAEDPHGVLTALDVDVKWTRPYHGQSKPIERYWRDLCEYAAKHPACSGAYLGNSPANKPSNYGQRSIPIAEFRTIVDGVIADLNARADRRGDMVAGRSFDDVFFESYRDQPVRQLTEAQRRMLLLAMEGVTARQGGMIEMFGNRYWSEGLSRAGISRRKVMIRFDPEHLDQPIHVYRLDGRYIAAAPCIESTGWADLAGAKKQARHVRDFKKGAAMQDRALNRMDAADLANLHRAIPVPAEPAAPDPTIVKPLFGKGGTPDASPDPDRSDADIQALFAAGLRNLKASAGGS